jgi:aspartyl-tRNA(Asn)/glutamyl-tRNA(Gln) amidotransferase subunit C
MPSSTLTPAIDAAAVRHIAGLARLELTDDQVALYQSQLSAVVGYVERLADLDLTSIEPLTNVGESTSAFRPDVPGPLLSTAALIAIAPDSLPPFVKIPKVLGDGGGA